MNEHVSGRNWVMVGFTTALIFLVWLVSLVVEETPQEAKIALGIALGASTLLWLAYAARIFGFLARDNRNHN